MWQEVVSLPAQREPFVHEAVSIGAENAVGLFFFFQVKKVPCISHIGCILLLALREHHWAIKTCVTRAWAWPCWHWAWWQQHQRKQPCCSTCVLPLVPGRHRAWGGRKAPVLLRNGVCRGNERVGNWRSWYCYAMFCMVRTTYVTALKRG